MPACPWPAGRAFPAHSNCTRPYPGTRHRVSDCGPTARNWHPTFVACHLVIEAAVAPESAGRAAASNSVSAGSGTGEGREKNARKEHFWRIFAGWRRRRLNWPWHGRGQHDAWEGTSGRLGEPRSVLGICNIRRRRRRCAAAASAKAVAEAAATR